MNIDLQTLPTTIDPLHVGLAVIAVVFFILFLVKGKGNNTPAPAPQAQEKAPETTLEPKPAAPAKTAPVLKEASPDAALQLLTLLQQEGRFVDFIQEDLTTYSDADVGAAARVVHEGSKKALNTHFTLAPVRSEDEEAQVTLNEGFNASEMRLTGNVVGEAPFTGVLVHKGWKVTASNLPKIADGHDTRIIAPAEVEL
ncbi:Uncharacterised protein [BD1-7 clade bacterium]|uniref:DUF2760 domain-containing protein n=1 Tax=BD1-7 clade bacterium TaxID=2029982 RepID=A0A5S9PJC2_9GAMM|nr:Uncharacterised protein [BD1-7 clade bacterium]